MEAKGDRVVLEFEIPSRGIIGLRSQMLTNTQGEAIMTHRFKEFQPYKGEIPSRQNGSMIGMYTGKAIPYSMFQLQERGKFFIQANVDVYEGQILGERGRPMDLVINVIKSKKLSNIRSSGADDKIKLIPPVQFTLEEALEYIQEDEYVEVTPKSIRLRKVLLKEHDRKRARNAALAIA
jgi:GTP-binding protein